MNKKILVIEDEEVISSLLIDNLELMGYEAIAARSGLEGLRKAELFSPDLITLDIMMPGLDGITVLEKLKANEKTKDIPVILVSAVSGDMREKGLQLGASAFFKKPFDFSSLDAKIQSITHKKSVLVVDDNPEVLKLLKLRLGNMGYEVECASDFKSMQASIERQKPDVILMDVVLSSESGLEIIKKLKKDEKTCEIPVIAFSGFVGDEFPTGSIAGVDKFINRRFDARELAEEVNNVVRNSEV